MRRRQVRDRQSVRDIFTLGDRISGNGVWISHRVRADGQALLTAALSTSPAVSPTEVRLTLFSFTQAAGFIEDLGFATGIPTAQAGKRAFDLALETASGQGMVVYGDNTAGPQYRTYDEITGWSAPAAVFAAPAGTQPVRWVKLAAHPSSDELTLAYAVGDTRAYVTTWNGDAWDQAPLDMGQSGYSGEEGFDIAYERPSGAAHFLLADSCCSCNQTLRRTLASDPFDVWGVSCAFVAGVPQYASSFTGNQMVAVGPMAAMAYDGQGWGDSANVAGGTTLYTVAAFVPSTDVAIVLGTHWGGDVEVYWTRYTPGSGFVAQPGFALSLEDGVQKAFVDVKALPSEARLVFVVSDDDRSLWSGEYTEAGGMSVHPVARAVGTLAPSSTHPVFDLVTWQP